MIAVAAISFFIINFMLLSVNYLVFFYSLVKLGLYHSRSVSAKEVPPPVHSPPAISFFTGGYPFLCRLRAVLSGSTSYHITSTSKPCYTASCACIVAFVAPHKIMCTVTAEGLKQDGRTDVRRGLLFHYGRRARTL